MEGVAASLACDLVDNGDNRRPDRVKRNPCCPGTDAPVSVRRWAQSLARPGNPAD